MQKATSSPTQPFCPAKAEEFGGETSHNACVSFQGTLVLGFTKATISCLGLQAQIHNLKWTQLHQVLHEVLQDSPSLYQKAYLDMKFEWLYLLKVTVFFLSPKVTSVSCYLIGPLCLTGNPLGCSEFDLW